MAASDGRPISPHTENARQLRRNATIPERMLWNRLRGGRLAGLKFRRQQPIGPYIVDFFCHEVGLVVEVDGRSHDGGRKIPKEKLSSRSNSDFRCSGSA